MKKQFYYQLSEHFFQIQEKNSMHRMFVKNPEFNSIKGNIFQKHMVNSRSKTSDNYNRWYNYQQFKNQLNGGVNSWATSPFFLKLRTRVFSVENNTSFAYNAFHSSNPFERAAISGTKFSTLSNAKGYSQYIERRKLVKRFPQYKDKIIEGAYTQRFSFWGSFPKTWLRRKINFFLKKQEKKIFVKKRNINRYFQKNNTKPKKYYLIPKETAQLYNSKNKLGQLLSTLSTNGISKTRLFFVNRFSFSRFLFNWEFAPKIKNRAQITSKSTRFFTKMDRYRTKRFRYRAVFLEDFARIAFFALAMKKSKVLLQFCALAIANLPRKRKETNFRRFFIKLLKIFSSVRPEISGVRFRMNGRVNRWNRRKQIRGQQGVLAFQTLSQHIDYASVHAVNRKGALGLRLWVVYDYKYQHQYSQAIIAYFSQSKKVRNKKQI